MGGLIGSASSSTQENLESTKSNVVCSVFSVFSSPTVASNINLVVSKEI